MKNMILRLALAAVLAVGFAPLASAAAKPKVVATFSILGDMVAEVGGARIELTVLAGPDADAHDFQPRPADARAVARADVFFVNGRGFDAWADRLARASGGKARLVRVTAAVKARPRDPHAWQDVSNALIYVDAIESALGRQDPEGAGAYRAAADAYRARLAGLHADIRAAIAAIPADRRKVVTSHDAFGFYGAAYGIRFLAPLGLSTHAQASGKSLGRLVRQIREEAIVAMFLENVSDPRLIEQVARETGARIGGRLYTDALSAAGGPAPDYVAMMRHNTRLLTAAMAKGS